MKKSKVTIEALRAKLVVLKAKLVVRNAEVDAALIVRDQAEADYRKKAYAYWLAAEAVSDQAAKLEIKEGGTNGR